MDCPICGYKLMRDGYEIICINCGCKAGTIDTIEIIDRQSAADMRNFYMLIMEAWIGLAERDLLKEAEKTFYHNAKERAEHYADIAGDMTSNKWLFADYIKD